MPRPSVRPSLFADDSWYPRDPASLRQRIDLFLANVPSEPMGGELMGLISPHAGYAFSGQTAAYSYKQIEGRTFRRVIALGPSHREDLGAQAVNRSDFFETPLGRIELDADAVKELGSRVGVNFVSRDYEHSLEVQLPFLQRELGSFKLVPIMMSHPFYVFGIRALGACQNLSAALAPLMDEQTLLVASSDLSHLLNYDAVVHFDQLTENLLVDYDIAGLADHMVNEGECRACGDVAIMTLLLTARARGANQVRVLYRTNSGDVTGIRTPGQYTVGYMAAAVYRSEN